MCTGYDKKIRYFNINKTPHLYKGILYPEDTTCGFIGFVTTLSWVQTSDLQARWFIKYIVGKIKKPTKEIEIHLKKEKIILKKNIKDYRLWL